MRTLVKRGRQLADWVILERKMYTILTVEDDLHINNLLKEALGKAGYACSQAFSGTEDYQAKKCCSRSAKQVMCRSLC